jgi:hypothetical protein
MTKLVRASDTLVRNSLGSPWVHTPVARPSRAERGCEAPTLKKERVPICSVTPLPRVGFTPHQSQQCADAVCPEAGRERATAGSGISPAGQ